VELINEEKKKTLTKNLRARDETAESPRCETLEDGTRKFTVRSRDVPSRSGGLRHVVFPDNANGRVDGRFCLD